MNEERRLIANQALTFFCKNVSILPNGKIKFFIGRLIIKALRFHFL